MQKITDKNSILHQIVWKKLQHGVSSRKSPYHILTCSYLDVKKRIKSCCVVIRRTIEDKRQLYFHSDIRHRKIEALQQHPYISFCVYSKEDKLQFRLHGKAHIHYNNEITESTWGKMQNLSKVCYATDINPGTRIPLMNNGFTKERWEKRFDLVHEESTFNNFAIVEITLDEIEILYLAIDGHQRHQSIWIDEEKRWEHHWLSP